MITKEAIALAYKEIQDEICQALEKLDVMVIIFKRC